VLGVGCHGHPDRRCCREVIAERVQPKGFLLCRVLRLVLVVIVHLLDESSENENLN